MVLTGRHFIPEHFGILFAFFGLTVQKLSNFKVHLHFLSFKQIPEIGPKRFSPGRGLATVTDC